MGMIGSILGASPAVSGVGKAVGDAAEVFVGNQAERDAAQSQQLLAAMQQFGLEFQQPTTGPFDRFMNALNRLPRPLLVIATFALFGYCMADPAGFAARMRSLDLVPDPLWWLLGAIVSFYFGARELHYQRGRGASLPVLRKVDTPSEVADTPADVSIEPSAMPLAKPAALRPKPSSTATPAAGEMRAADPQFNAAVEDWRHQAR